MGRSIVDQESQVKMVILHIGASKTGCSAIQEFLRPRAGVPRQCGFLVAPPNLTPRDDVTAQHVWFIEQLRGDRQRCAILANHRASNAWGT